MCMRKEAVHAYKGWASAPERAGEVNYRPGVRGDVSQVNWRSGSP
jgi:hypothetical protein